MIAIVDYGMGNLGSIRNMLARIGAQATITSTPEDIRSADKLILPGVGAFDRAVQNLRRLRLVEVLESVVVSRGTPILGICLGMQLFSRCSEEGTLPGLGWIDADTVRFSQPADGPPIKIPHMGWNTVEVRRPGSILDSLANGARFYFVHSYHVRCCNQSEVVAVTRHGGEFHAMVMRDNVVGVQFHPEKSHKFGMALLRSFAEA